MLEYYARAVFIWLLTVFHFYMLLKDRSESLETLWWNFGKFRKCNAKMCL